MACSNISDGSYDDYCCSQTAEVGVGIDRLQGTIVRHSLLSVQLVWLGHRLPQHLRMQIEAHCTSTHDPASFPYACALCCSLASHMLQKPCVAWVVCLLRVDKYSVMQSIQSSGFASHARVPCVILLLWHHK